MANATDSDRSPSAQDGPGPDASQSEVEADIERTREDLGHTVELLAEKLDVKAQAQHKVEDIKHNAAGAVDETRQKATDLVAAAKAKMSSAVPGSSSSGDHTAALEASATGATAPVSGRKVRVESTNSAGVPPVVLQRAVPFAVISVLSLTGAIVVLVRRRR